MARLVLLLCLLSPFACRNKEDSATDTGTVIVDTQDTAPVDADDDGYPASTDCDDEDADVFPGAVEVCNDEIDDAVGDTWYADEDEDGYGDPEVTTQDCDGATGYVADDTDCDDTDGAVNPGATEVCNGFDDDCDTLVDDDDPDVDDPGTWYWDVDEDGHGDPDAPTVACELPSGASVEATDCDDSDSEVHPDADEVCNDVDDDCDGLVDDDDPDLSDASTWYLDFDGDGFGNSTFTVDACEAPSGYVDNDQDCEDAYATANPLGTEVCDGLDNDCDGTVDDAATDATTWYSDADGDGYGDSTTGVVDCEAPSDGVEDGTDCDDTDASRNPDTVWYADGDGDGYGDPDTTAASCEAPSEAWVLVTGDCDDGDADTHEGGTEVCGGADEDCDGLTDDDDPTVSDPSTWAQDYDGDGYGGTVTVEACEAPSGYLADQTDCDDGEASTYPGATELCDGVDQDCDGTADNDATGGSTWYDDTDGDGFGDPAAATVSCEQPSGTVADDSDCDDADAAVNPDAAEVCNDVDDDCNGWTDADDPGVTDAVTFYADSDGDGHGVSTYTTEACEAPSGYVDNADDCDDLDAAVSPDAAEVCNGLDDDCSGAADDDDPGLTDPTTFYGDDDGDGYGETTDTATGCEAPSGYVESPDDCDDTDTSIHPGAAEQCDSTDHDCDGDAGLSSCTDCAALLGVDSTLTDGVHTIDLDGDGGQEAFDVTCDMSTDGGGWTLWWWKEASDPFTSVTDTLADDLWDCDPSSDGLCLGTIPVDAPSELLVTNHFGDWAVWEFDGSSTSDAALAAFTQRTEQAIGAVCGVAWNPVVQSGAMTDDPYHCDETNNQGSDNCDCFWYDEYDGVWSFYLDDDTGWAETAFGAGIDNSGSYGVDSLETEYRYHDTSFGLWMYWR